MEILGEYELEDMFDNMINENTDMVNICGYLYSPADALREIDQIAYRQEFLAWLDQEIEEGYLTEKEGVYYVVR